MSDDQIAMALELHSNPGMTWKRVARAMGVDVIELKNAVDGAKVWGMKKYDGRTVQTMTMRKAAHNQRRKIACKQRLTKQREAT